MQFTYFNPVKIRFGVDYLESVKGVANRSQDARFLLVTSKGFSKRGLSEKIANALGTQLVGIVDEILPNPQLKHLQEINASISICII
ncbi:iron-containing alcohol dehydrogenase [Helicobacter sp. T3_23-1056]